MLPRSEKFAPAVVLAIGLATILAAWAFELIGNYVPCKLCLEERVPYYIALPLTLAGLLAAVAGAKPLVSRTFLIAAGIIFAFGVYLGAYHAGAEWALWSGPTDCGGGSALPTDTNDLMNQLKGIHIVSCTEATWVFPFRGFGLSFAGWNTVISLALAAIAFWGAFRPLAPEPARGEVAA
jgi:disulfide bond formation protein DsbB